MLHLTNCGQIRLTRGDSCTIPLEINQGTAMDPIKYELQETDTLYFGVMEPNQPFETAILRKKFTAADSVEGTVYLNLSPSDTLCLIPGLYYYQVKIQSKIAEKTIVKTLIPKTQFWIQE